MTKRQVSIHGDVGYDGHARIDLAFLGRNGLLSTSKRVAEHLGERGIAQLIDLGRLAHAIPVELKGEHHNRYDRADEHDDEDAANVLC